ncbi:MAG: hypothetical protein QOA16_02135, partial [Nitrososphaeraceae archaeon]|nr:hypothetical protein [Nitrososphaeraceae archaeon]
MSRNFKLYFVSILPLIGFVLFANYDQSNAQSNLTAPSLQSNLPTPNGPPTVDTPNTSTSITETLNDVLSGSIDGMIGETVDMLSSDTAKVADDSPTSSLENELPSSLTLDKNNESAVQDT